MNNKGVQPLIGILIMVFITIIFASYALTLLLHPFATSSEQLVEANSNGTITIRGSIDKVEDDPGYNEYEKVDSIIIHTSPTLFYNNPTEDITLDTTMFDSKDSIEFETDTSSETFEVDIPKQNIESKTVQISSRKELQDVVFRRNNKYVLTEDINLQGDRIGQVGKRSIGGKDADIIYGNGTVQTTFDGKNHTLSGFKVTGDGLSNCGTVKNLRVENYNIAQDTPVFQTGYVTTGWYTPHCIGIVYSNIHAEGNSVFSQTNSETVIRDSHVTLQGDNSLLRKNNGNIINVTVAGKIEGDRTGGIAIQNRGTIRNSTVESNVSGGNRVGGLVAINNGTVSNSSVVGNVTGNIRVGGLVGVNKKQGSVYGNTFDGNVSGSRYVGEEIGIDYAHKTR